MTSGINTPINTPSPFITYRNHLLHDYGAARFLKNVLLSLYNGSPVALTGCSYLDEKHLPIFLAIIKSYTERGELDEAFMSLADELLKRRADPMVTDCG